MPITALYAGLLAPLFIFLSFRVIGVRRAARISLGDGADPELLKRIRVHANFAEYTPFALLCMALAESLGTLPIILHAIGVALLAGRYAHAIGVSRTPQIMMLRVAGMVATMTAIGAAAVCCFVQAVERLFA